MPKKRMLDEIVECKECGEMDLTLKQCPHCEKTVCEECWEEHVDFCRPDDSVAISPWNVDIPVDAETAEEDENEELDEATEEKEDDDDGFLGNFNLERE